MQSHDDDHPKFLAHHFQSHRQQFDAGKLGMWIFLLTEILLFGGLFCAYAVYRSNHPEIFVYAHQFLDKSLGALNTCVLILSSLTMAWGVRCAQTNQRRGLIACLALTLLCACGFLGVKGIEYRSKWREGLLWASKYDPKGAALREKAAVERATTNLRSAPGSSSSAPPAPKAAPASKNTAGQAGSGAREKGDASPEAAALGGIDPRRVGVFFSIYFFMTGLHAVHVLAGMAAIGWILSRAVRGDFNSGYFGPVDYVGLYWHLVDMIWIYLFPLLYLIH